MFLHVLLCFGMSAEISLLIVSPLPKEGRLLLVAFTASVHCVSRILQLCRFPSLAQASDTEGISGMIAAGSEGQAVQDPSAEAPVTSDFDWTILVRYGRIPQVARFGGNGIRSERDAQVVVVTDRGEELGTVLHVDSQLGGNSGSSAVTGKVLRMADRADLQLAEQQDRESEQSFGDWDRRISDWSLQLQVVDLELTLDGQLIIYVLNERGPETTRLALLAAAAGAGVIHVQPVGPDGIEQGGGGGGCGDCGCSTH